MPMMARLVAVTCLVATMALWVAIAPSRAATALPDGRVYELVSPAQKSGGIGGVFPLGTLTLSVEQVGRPLQSAVDGEAITYLGEDFYKSQLGSLNQYLSTRGVNGWSNRNLTMPVPSPSEEAIEANPFVGFSADLSDALIGSTIPLAEGVPVGYANLYLTHGASIRPLITQAPPNRTSETFGHALYGRNTFRRSLLFSGANAGEGAVPAFSHVLFEANAALALGAVDGGPLKNNLYEWVEGHLRLVNVLPGGQAPPNASFGVDNSDTYVGQPTPSLSHVISADGSRIFWTDENKESHNLYLREDGERTVQVDEAVGGEGEFQTASTDGSRVFFSKSGHLYEYDVTGALTHDLLSEGGVLGVLGASDDGSYVYFVATSAASGKAIAGQPNLYLWHNGALTFIATLSFLDNENEVSNLYGTASPYGDWYRTFAGRTAEVAPDGRYVAFMSKAKLTEYENLEINGLEHAYEIFLYDADTGELVCASCNTDATRPTTSTLLPPAINGIYQQRYLDNNGRLFFSTSDAVIPQDRNGNSDVYEYENGGVHLISPATGPTDEAVFADASENGNDVFFTTQQQLVPGDPGEITDLYDARVGGRPEEEPAQSACAGEECRAQPTAPPLLEVPTPSAVFTGTGNLSAPLSSSGKTVKKVTVRRKRSRKLHKKRSMHGTSPRKHVKRSTRPRRR